MAASSNRRHWPRLWHGQLFTLLQTPQQKTGFDSRHLGERRSLDLPVEPRKRFVFGAHGLEYMSELTYTPRARFALRLRCSVKVRHQFMMANTGLRAPRRPCGGIPGRRRADMPQFQMAKASKLLISWWPGAESNTARLRPYSRRFLIRKTAITQKVTQAIFGVFSEANHRPPESTGALERVSGESASRLDQGLRLIRRRSRTSLVTGSQLGDRALGLSPGGSDRMPRRGQPWMSVGSQSGPVRPGAAAEAHATDRTSTPGSARCPRSSRREREGWSVASLPNPSPLPAAAHIGRAIGQRWFDAARLALLRS